MIKNKLRSKQTKKKKKKKKRKEKKRKSSPHDYKIVGVKGSE